MASQRVKSTNRLPLGSPRRPVFLGQIGPKRHCPMTHVDQRSRRPSPRRDETRASAARGLLLVPTITDKQLGSFDEHSPGLRSRRVGGTTGNPPAGRHLFDPPGPFPPNSRVRSRMRAAAHASCHPPTIPAETTRQRNRPGRSPESAPGHILLRLRMPNRWSTTATATRPNAAFLAPDSGSPPPHSEAPRPEARPG